MKSKTLIKYCNCLILIAFLSSPSILFAHGAKKTTKEIPKKEIHTTEKTENHHAGHEGNKKEIPKKGTHTIEKMGNDPGFDFSGLMETSSYRIVSPTEKGFHIVILFTGILWMMFFYLIKTGKKDSS